MRTKTSHSVIWMRAFIATITYSAERTSSTSKNYLCVGFPHSCSYSKPFHFVLCVSGGSAQAWCTWWTWSGSTPCCWSGNCSSMKRRCFCGSIVQDDLVLRLFILAVALHYNHFIFKCLLGSDYDLCNSAILFQWFCVMESCFAKVNWKASWWFNKTFFFYTL